MPPCCARLLLCAVLTATVGLVATACGGADAVVQGHAVLGAPTLSTQIRELTRGLPNAQYGRSIEVGDVDGDGDPDVLIGSRLYRNEGDGGFESVVDATPDVLQCTAAAFGDVDRDGDLDLLVAVVVVLDPPWQLPLVQLWQNDGSGRFADVTTTRLPANSGRGRDLALGDVDGDGDLDAVLAMQFEQDLLWRNDGTGRFTDATAAGMPAALDSHLVELADFDGDGDLDVLCGAADRMLRNLGGTFVTVAAALPTFGASDAAVGDLDGDGDLDLVVTRAASLADTTFLLQNDGDAHFTDQSHRLPHVFGLDPVLTAVAVGDVDGDGDRDILLGRPARLLRNDGAGSFDDAPHPDFGCVSRAALVDVDGDGDLDALLASSPSSHCYPSAPTNWLYCNDGQGGFRTSHRQIAAPLDGLLADFDGDLMPDRLVDATRMQFNDGSGDFGADVMTNTRFSPPIDGVPIAAHDFDGDGSQDLLVAGVGGTPCSLYRNDGTGHFLAVAFPDVTNVLAVAISDVDGDGRADLVLGRGGPQVPLPLPPALLLASGPGTFVDASAARLPSEPLDCSDIALGDVDGDGDLDIVLDTHAAGVRRIRCLWNAGNGSFGSEPWRSLDVGAASPRYGMHLVDLEGDGDLDLLVSGDRSHCCWRNVGGGGFQDVSANLSFSQGFDALLLSLWPVDFDDDGDLDVLALHNGRVVIHVQDAPMQFREDTPTQAFFSVHQPIPRPMDIDGDGDVEWYQRVNVVRHLHARTLATVGRAHRLQVFDRPGWLASEHIAWLFLALEPNPQPMVTPAGVFRLGAIGATTLPALTIPAPVGVVTASVLIPPVPALVGATLRAQALIMDPASGVGRFTNMVADVIGN